MFCPVCEAVDTLPGKNRLAANFHLLAVLASALLRRLAGVEVIFPSLTTESYNTQRISKSGLEVVVPSLTTESYNVSVEAVDAGKELPKPFTVLFPCPKYRYKTVKYNNK
ncbi:MAG: hypothetical protein NC211_02715 [Alistipes senegalensis]|nr:hypothetical protein [Alistipes senegalensis]